MHLNMVGANGLFILAKKLSVFFSLFSLLYIANLFSQCVGSGCHPSNVRISYSRYLILLVVVPKLRCTGAIYQCAQGSRLELWLLFIVQRGRWRQEEASERTCSDSEEVWATIFQNWCQGWLGYFVDTLHLQIILPHYDLISQIVSVLPYDWILYLIYFLNNDAYQEGSLPERYEEGDRTLASQIGSTSGSRSHREHSLQYITRG